MQIHCRNERRGGEIPFDLSRPLVHISLVRGVKEPLKIVKASGQGRKACINTSVTENKYEHLCKLGGTGRKVRIWPAPQRMKGKAVKTY